ncbi:Hypp5605 [Branchiostoma lanceolatum]|nr:Hypp5605 [Branchiostoma lanceolatum]
MKRLNKYFTERVYTPLVENLFPAHGMEKAATSLTGHAQAVTVLSKTAQSQQAGAAENGKSREQAAKVDDRTAKFLRTVTRLFKLQQRWSRLSSDGPISVVLFEAETNRNSTEADSAKPFHIISQLVPDLVAKASKAVAITDKWYKLFVGLSDSAVKDEASSRERQIEELREKISKTSRTIQELETNLADYQEELAGLTAKDARYDELTEAFQIASVSSEELSTDISDLEETEKKITKQLEDFSRRKEIKEYEGLKQEAGHIQQKLQSTR